MDDTDLKKGESNVGGLDNRFYCRVFIKDVEITSDQIYLLAIRSWIFEKTPRLELQFKDGGKFFSLYPLMDFDEIKVIISSAKKDVNYIDATFKLHDHFINQEGGNRKIYSYGLTALLESKTFYFESKNRSFKDKNSSDVLAEIASDAGLKSDIRQKSNDKMTWYQINATDSEMIDHILQRAYIQDDDAAFMYTDTKSNFVYTSLKNELAKKPKLKAVYLSDDVNPAYKKSPDDKAIKIKNFALQSFNGTFNKRFGYNSSLSYYDESEKTLSLSDDKHSLTTKSLKNKNNIKYNTDTMVLGMLTKNMHADYFKGAAQNVYERYNNFPVCVEISFDMKNQPDAILNDETAFNLFDIIDVEFASNMGEKNKVYSGKYIIGNITHQISRTSGKASNSSSMYTITMLIFRNGHNFDASLLKESAIVVS